MAKNAEFPSLRHRGFGRGIPQMRLRGPVTGLARERFMVTVLLLAGLPDMASAAHGAAGKRNILCQLSFYGGLSMKSRVDEGGREDQISYYYHCRDDRPDNDGQSSYLFRNFPEKSLDFFQHNQTMRTHYPGSFLLAQACDTEKN